jgi:hypothetical protein
MSLPATDLRSNVGTWSVPNWRLPSVAKEMLSLLESEKYDPDFRGQYLQTTYFDTKDFSLRKARLRGRKYVTLRIRCYAPSSGAGNSYPEGSYAISAKTELQKYRQQLDSRCAESLLSAGIQPASLVGIMQPDIIARISDLSIGETLQPIATVCFNRFAVEDERHRLTLDIDIKADTGWSYASHVLEQKSTDQNARPLLNTPLRPIKLSKFLWVTARGNL